MRPTIVDVAERAGVSKGLVSLALNRRPGVAESTRRRILAAADDLGWTPSLPARALSTARAYSLGLVIARDPGVLAADPFFPAFIAGVETALADTPYSLTLSMVASPSRERDVYRRLAGERRVDGGAGQHPHHDGAGEVGVAAHHGVEQHRRDVDGDGVDRVRCRRGERGEQRSRRGGVAPLEGDGDDDAVVTDDRGCRATGPQDESRGRAVAGVGSHATDCPSWAAALLRSSHRYLVRRRNHRSRATAKRMSTPWTTCW